MVGALCFVLEESFLSWTQLNLLIFFLKQSRNKRIKINIEKASMMMHVGYIQTNYYYYFVSLLIIIISNSLLDVFFSLFDWQLLDQQLMFNLISGDNKANQGPPYMHTCMHALINGHHFLIPTMLISSETLPNLRGLSPLFEFVSHHAPVILRADIPLDSF